MLIGRQTECAVLDRLITAVRSGQSRVLVVHGAAGIGKTALLEYARHQAGDIRVVAAPGIESEMELPFALLHQLCTPLLDRLPRLPPGQSAALETAFGRRPGPAPDRFLVGLAMLSLLADVSAEGPLICVIDDAQWMDRASAQVLGFVSRRLLAESIAVVFATRRPGPELIGLPRLEVPQLRDTDAHALLDDVPYGRLDRHIRDRIVVEARGNPQALRDQPRDLTATELAGGLGLLTAGPLPGPLVESVAARLAGLPPPTRLLLLVAAAEPAGDPTLVWRACDTLGITPADALAGGTGGLLTIDERVTFRHPLFRPALYRAAAAADRRAVHRALAEATDERVAPDRRAWHLAAAAAGPDEGVAATLERSAGRARTRGGFGAAAAFLHRSVALSAEPASRTGRAVAAAQASLRAGDLDAARRFAHVAERDAGTEAQRARAQLVRSEISFVAGGHREAPALFLAAAQRLGSADIPRAREAYLLAWGAALVTADFDQLAEISRTIRALPAPPGPPGALDLVLEGAALLVTGERAAALPRLRGAVSALVGLPAADRPRWVWVAGRVVGATWDEDALTAVYAHAVKAARDTGARADLPFCLSMLGAVLAGTGDFAGAAGMADRADAVAATTGIPFVPRARLQLSALRGRPDETEPLIAAVDAGADGHWAAAVLGNGLGRFAHALGPAGLAARGADPVVAARVLPELIEAAVREDDLDTARTAVDNLADATLPCGTDWALGVLARSRALVTDGPAAEDLYTEAIERLDRTAMRPERARAHLLFGEWLRRADRRAEARARLQTAYGELTSIGMEAFAERARRELLATGGTAPRPQPSRDGELTPQERQIALLVREGYSNPEVGARLFLSPRTVEWHLRKIFTKLSITSRRQLRDVLSPDTHEPVME